MNPSSSTIKSNKNYSKHSSTLKLSSSASSPKKPPSQYQFTPTQVLINQILKVLKLRLIIENIKIPDEKIIEIIKSNLTLIDIRYFKMSSLNVFVDDLVEIIKKEQQAEKEEKKKQKMPQQSFNSNTRTTILSFNRKEYEQTNNVLGTSFSNLKKSSLITKEPMKFSLANRNIGQNNVAFYLEGNNGNEITTLNDCDIEEMQEKIIDEVSKEYFKEKEEAE